jgi:perosamine synthetase
LTEPIEADFGRFISHMMPDGISGNYCASFVLNEKYSTKRDSIILKLKDLDIGTSIYYPVALPQSAYYKSNPRLSRRLDSSNAELLASSSIAFGVGPHLSAEDMVHVRNQFDSVLKGLE